MLHYGLPLIFAIFLWWFSTGVIIYLDNLPVRTFRWSMLGATLLLPVALYGIRASVNDTSVAGAYLAFSSALLAWSWLEISFYMGFVTGPRTHACEVGCSGWRHFGHALAVSLWHELAIVGFAIGIIALTGNAPNSIAKWTFLVLWWMHESARLNVFLGVRNLNEHFVPAHLSFLKSFLTKRPMNLLFPVSVSVSTVVAVLLVQAAWSPGASTFQAAGFTFLAGLMVLAILEHWFLVLPLPSEALWSWSAPRVIAVPEGSIQPSPADRSIRDAQPISRSSARVQQGTRLFTRPALATGTSDDFHNKSSVFNGRRRP